MSNLGLKVTITRAGGLLISDEDTSDVLMMDLEGSLSRPNIFELPPMFEYKLVIE